MFFVRYPEKMNKSIYSYSNQSLFNAIGNLNRRLNPKGEAIAHLEEVLKSGVDINAPNNQGVLPLSFLYDKYAALLPNNRTYLHAARLLFQYGADPTIAGCDFLGRNNRVMLENIIPILIERLKVDKNCLSNQQSPLHALITQRPAYISYLPEGDYLVEWLNQQRLSDKKTPLHLLWLDNGNFMRGAGAVWATTADLFALGANFQLEDSNGQTPAQIINKAIHSGKFKASNMNGSALMKYLSVIHEQDQLNSNTSAVDQKRIKPGMRL